MGLDRNLNSLEVLLLVFIKAGLSTAYQLMLHAGMSAGLTGPALKRLAEAKLLAGTDGPRNVVRYAITSEGEKSIRESVESDRKRRWLPEPHSAFESGARNALLALLYEGHGAALDSVDSATEALREQGHRKKREAADLHESMLSLNKRFFENQASCDQGILLATAYRWMKATSAASLLELQAEAMRTLIPLISEFPATAAIQMRPEPLKGKANEGENLETTRLYDEPPPQNLEQEVESLAKPSNPATDDLQYVNLSAAQPSFVTLPQPAPQTNPPSSSRRRTLKHFPEYQPLNINMSPETQVTSEKRRKSVDGSAPTTGLPARRARMKTPIIPVA